MDFDLSFVGNPRSIKDFRTSIVGIDGTLASQGGKVLCCGWLGAGCAIVCVGRENDKYCKLQRK